MCKPECKFQSPRGVPEQGQPCCTVARFQQSVLVSLEAAHQSGRVLGVFIRIPPEEPGLALKMFETQVMMQVACTSL